MGRFLLGAGFLLVLAGLAVMAAERLGWPLGRLPGDLSFRGKHVQIFAPLGTSFVLSVLLTVVLYLVSRLRR